MHVLHTVTRQSLACQSDTASTKPPSLVFIVKCELRRMAALPEAVTSV